MNWGTFAVVFAVGVGLVVASILVAWAWEVISDRWGENAGTVFWMLMVLIVISALIGLLVP